MLIYRLQPEALNDLEDIWFYTAKKWGVEKAIEYIDLLNAKFSAIAEQPLLNRERLEFTPPVRLHHHRSHLIVYTLIDEGIVIIRVLHKNMDVENQL